MVENLGVSRTSTLGNTLGFPIVVVPMEERAYAVDDVLEDAAEDSGHGGISDFLKKQNVLTKIQKWDL